MERFGRSICETIQIQYGYSSRQVKSFKDGEMKQTNGPRACLEVERKGRSSQAPANGKKKDDQFIF